MDRSPLSVGFPRQEYWSGLPFPSPGDLPDPGIESGSLVLQADSTPTKPPKEAKAYIHNVYKMLHLFSFWGKFMYSYLNSQEFLKQYL